MPAFPTAGLCQLPALLNGGGSGAAAFRDILVSPNPFQINHLRRGGRETTNFFIDITKPFV